MKFTNGEIFSAREPLGKLSQMSFPVRTSYQIAKLIRKIGEPFQVIEEVRGGLVKKYGTEERGGNYGIKPTIEIDGEEAANPKWEQFVKEFNELMAQEVELVFDPVVLPNSLEIEPATLLTLEKFISFAE